MHPAYLAGYTDAEGCFHLVRQDTGKYIIWSARVSFRQVDSKVVTYLHERFGGTLSIEIIDGKQPLNFFRLQKLGAVQAFVELILEHLREKRSQAEILRMFEPKAGDEINQLAKIQITEDKWAHQDTFVTRRSSRKITRITRTRTPSEDERAYFAGYFDGDGSLVMRKHRGGYRYPTIAFHQTRLDMIRIAREIYGGSLTINPAANARSRDRFHWQLCQLGAVRAFLDDVSEFVVEKRDAVDEARKYKSPAEARPL